MDSHAALHQQVGLHKGGAHGKGPGEGGTGWPSSMGLHAQRIPADQSTGQGPEQRGEQGD